MPFRIKDVAFAAVRAPAVFALCIAVYCTPFRDHDGADDVAVRAGEGEEGVPDLARRHLRVRLGRVGSAVRLIEGVGETEERRAGDGTERGHGLPTVFLDPVERRLA